MKNIVLSAFLGLGTLSLMAAESQQQPEVGKAAPDFSLTTGDGSQVSLKDYRGKWVVLYFYPKDFTSGCTMEAHNFQRDLAKYEGRRRSHSWRERGHCAIAQGFLREGRAQFQIAGRSRRESLHRIWIGDGLQRQQTCRAEHVHH